MCGFAVAIFLLQMWASPVMYLSGPSDSDERTTSKAIEVTIADLDLSAGILKVRYEVTNGSEQDIWMLAGVGRSGVNAETFMDEDGSTLLIHRRLDVPTGIALDLLYGRYIRLRPGTRHAESIVLAIPVYGEWMLSDVREGLGLEQATAVAVEIGYYVGDLPGMLQALLERADRIAGGGNTFDERTLKGYLRGSLYFNMMSEELRDRNEEALVPYTFQRLKGERFLRSEPANARVTYDGRFDPDRRATEFDLPSCTRIEIDYHPSMLDFFFPYPSEQRLLDPQERQQLTSRATVVTEDSRAVQAFVDGINMGVPTLGRVPQVAWADVVCYAGTARLTSFPVCNDDSVVKDARDRLAYPDGVRALRELTPEVKPLELRVRCAHNLKNLWYRLRLYRKAGQSGDDIARNEIRYPDSVTWADAIVTLFRETTVDPSGRIGTTHVLAPYRCPSAGRGTCHYAMNPHCEPNSPGDTVLLFETTKAGWNQHGGPELFTFDNHDPKGGCVLLNDGSVKFIRTEEELQQLRWKP